jgi:formate/nitrite transporter FocA (FNT family)
MRRHALFSGVLIGLGGAGFLALGGIPGAVIFAFGLIGVVLSGVPLYTGKAGALPLKETWSLLEIWFWNVVGCVMVGLLLKYSSSNYTAAADAIVQGRFQSGVLGSFLRAIGCGVIIDIAVYLYRKSGSLLPVLFGVPLFILCGFYHSIADVVYLTVSWKWSPDILWYYPSIFLGNYVGCNMRRVILPQRMNN